MPLPACASALRDSPWILAPLANLRRPLRSQTLCSLLQSLRAYQVIGNISQTPPPAPPETKWLRTPGGGSICDGARAHQGTGPLRFALGPTHFAEAAQSGRLARPAAHQLACRAQ